MPLHLGAPELLIVLFIVLIIFGAGRISSFGRDLGRGIREMRTALREDEGQKKTETEEKSQV